jgi:hypothetical protein
MVLEPKVYTLLVSSARGQVLHLGVHFSLEEAYSSARKRLEELTPHNKGDAMDIQLWNSMPARQAIAFITDPTKINEVFPENVQQTITPIAHGAVLVEGFGKLPPVLEALLNATPTMQAAKAPAVEEKPPTVTDHIQDLKDSKNDLMKKLIADGDINQVEKIKGLLGSYSRKYVLKEIERKGPKPSSVSEPKVEQK